MTANSVENQGQIVEEEVVQMNQTTDAKKTKKRKKSALEMEFSDSEDEKRKQAGDNEPQMRYLNVPEVTTTQTKKQNKSTKVQ